MNMICGGGWYKPLRRSLTLSALLAACLVQAAPPPPPAAAITFNTACAGCHEGECSGRLSFKNGMVSASGHIRRYAGPLRDDEVAALFEQLKYMKEHCAYYPLVIPVPHDRVWAREALRALFSPAGKGYFVPLGELEAGRYQVDLIFDRETEVHLQVLGSDFSFLLEKNSFASGSVFEASFSNDVRSRYFLRLYPGDLARLVEMRVTSCGH